MNDNNLNNLPLQQDPPDDRSIVDASDSDVDLPPLDFDNKNMQNLQKKVVSLPVEANDTDLIEKEWVNVLQDIVRHTSEDPFTQQNEISRLKVDYMKKRYNRDVKHGG